MPQSIEIARCWRLALQEIKNDGFTWVNVDKPTRADMKDLGQRFGFHELNLADCLSKIQIPKIDRYANHIFVILHFARAERESIPKSTQLAAFIGSGYLVTVHQEDLKPLAEMFEQCRSSDKARQELMDLGLLSLPVLLIGEQKLTGFNPGKIDEALAKLTG